MPGRIVSIFGRKGSGKSTLSKVYMEKWGGRVIFMSPVETLKVDHFEAWHYDEIEAYMTDLRLGDILLIRRADIEAMEFVGSLALSDVDGNYTFVIDEVDKYKGSKELENLCHYARHAKIDLIANTRRYADMPRLLTSQSDELCFFGTHEPADIEYCRKLAGKEFAESLKDLPPFHYITYPEREILKTRLPVS